MGKVTAALLIILVFINTTGAFRCYDCLYFEGDAPENEYHDDRCKEANEEDTDLSVNCEELTYIPHPHGGSNTLMTMPKTWRSRTPKNTTRRISNEDGIFSCVTMKMDGEMRDFDTSYSTTAIYRFCILIQNGTQALPTKCYRSINDEIEDEMEELDLKLDLQIFFIRDSYTNETAAEICGCGTEYCNGENDSETEVTTYLPDSTTSGSFSFFAFKFIYFSMMLVAW